MRTYKILEAVCLAGIAFIFAGASLLLFSLMKQIADFILHTSWKLFVSLSVAGCLLAARGASAQSKSLNEAVMNNSIKEVEAFLRNGADPNAYDDDSDNVLVNAAMYSSAECMELLLKHKANPEFGNRFGQKPLMLCTNDVEKMKLLLQWGADINDTSRSGNCALLMACSGYGKYETIKWLIDKGANTSVKRWNTETPLMRSVRFGDTMTIALFLNMGFDINAHPWRVSPLMIAVRLGNWDAVSFLVGHGADVNIPDEDNNPAVMYAAEAGDLEMVRLLMPGTKNINTKNVRAGMTPLMWATINEHDDPAIIQAFLNKGAKVNLKADDGGTALSWAMKKGNTRTVELLRRAGAKE
jgi:ankyrin repeat protein